MRTHHRAMMTVLLAAVFAVGVGEAQHGHSADPPDHFTAIAERLELTAAQRETLEEPFREMMARPRAPLSAPRDGPFLAIYAPPRRCRGRRPGPFHRAVRALADYDDRRPFSAWFYTIVRNVARTAISKDGRRAALAPLTLLQDEPPAPPAVDALVVADIERAIEALAPMQQSCVRLCNVEGFTSVEAARMLGVGEGTIRTHLRRARKQLRYSPHLGRITRRQSQVGSRWHVTKLSSWIEPIRAPFVRGARCGTRPPSRALQ